MARVKSSSNDGKHPYLREGFVFDSSRTPRGKILPPEKQEEFTKQVKEWMKKNPK